MAEDTTTTTETVTTETDATTDATPDLAADVEKWKAMARKQEARAKENAAAAKELEELKRAQMSEIEKAVEAARAEGRTEAMREATTEVVKAQVRAAAAGRGIDTDALLEGLDSARFVRDDFTVDEDAITAWVDRIAPQRSDGAHVVDIGQGDRGQSAAATANPLEAALRNKLGISH